MPELHGIMDKGVLTFSPIQTELKTRYLVTLKDGVRVKMILTRESRTKTNQQVRVMFGLAVEMIRQRLIDMRVDVCGIPPNKEMVYEIIKRACFGVGDMGETIGLSEMSTTQAWQAFDNVRTWSATQLQLVIPDPNPNWKDEKELVKAQ
jgi:hypothetical protein